MAARLLLLMVSVGWSVGVSAQEAPPTTFTRSTSSSSTTESPPACSPVGSERVVITNQTELAIGPDTIIIGDRDSGGTPFEVVSGSTNVNTNTLTTTITCVAATATAVPTMSQGRIIGLAGLIAAVGLWFTKRRRRRLVV